MVPLNATPPPLAEAPALASQRYAIAAAGTAYEELSVLSGSDGESRVPELRLGRTRGCVSSLPSGSKTEARAVAKLRSHECRKRSFSSLPKAGTSELSLRRASVLRTACSPALVAASVLKRTSPHG